MSSLRGLPSVDRLLRDPRLETVLHQYGRSMVTDVIRRVIAEAREDIAGNGDAVDEASLVDRVTRTAVAQATPSLRRVFNLTGTVLHTNLGRAPLPREAPADAKPIELKRPVESLAGSPAENPGFYAAGP